MLSVVRPTCADFLPSISSSIAFWLVAFFDFLAGSDRDGAPKQIARDRSRPKEKTPPSTWEKGGVLVGEVRRLRRRSETMDGSGLEKT